MIGVLAQAGFDATGNVVEMAFWFGLLVAGPLAAILLRITIRLLNRKDDHSRGLQQQAEDLVVAAADDVQNPYRVMADGVAVAVGDLGAIPVPGFGKAYGILLTTAVCVGGLRGLLEMVRATVTRLLFRGSLGVAQNNLAQLLILLATVVLGLGLHVVVLRTLLPTTTTRAAAVCLVHLAVCIVIAVAITLVFAGLAFAAFQW